MATKLWATRLGEFNIPVYEIRPVSLKRDMTAAVIEKYDKLFAEGICRTKSLGYAGRCWEIGRCPCQRRFLYSTGQVILIDGGLTVERL